MKKILMARGADKVVSTCVKVKPGEKVLIITEASRLSIAEAIAAAVYRVQAEPILQVMVPRDTDGQEPPAPVSAAMKASDAFISVVGRSITHTHAVKDAIAGGSRGVVLTQFTEDMMIHGGIEADFEAARTECKAVAAALAGSEKIHLTTAMGTDLYYGGKRGILNHTHGGGQCLASGRHCQRGHCGGRQHSLHRDRHPGRTGALCG